MLCGGARRCSVRGVCSRSLGPYLPQCLVLCEFPPSVVMLCCLLVAATTNVENTAHSTEQIQEMWGVLKRCCRPLSQVWFLSVMKTSCNASFLVHSETNACGIVGWEWVTCCTSKLTHITERELRCNHPREKLCMDMGQQQRPEPQGEHYTPLSPVPASGATGLCRGSARRTDCRCRCAPSCQAGVCSDTDRGSNAGSCAVRNQPYLHHPHHHPRNGILTTCLLYPPRCKDVQCCEHPFAFPGSALNWFCIFGRGKVESFVKKGWGFSCDESISFYFPSLFPLSSPLLLLLLLPTITLQCLATSLG